MRNKEEQQLELPDHHGERVIRFAKKKGSKKTDYTRREQLEDRKYWN